MTTKGKEFRIYNFIKDSFKIFLTIENASRLQSLKEIVTKLSLQLYLNIGINLRECACIYAEGNSR